MKPSEEGHGELVRSMRIWIRYLAQWVKLPLGVPASQTGVPCSSPSYSNLLLMQFPVDAYPGRQQGTLPFTWQTWMQLQDPGFCLPLYSC